MNPQDAYRKVNGQWTGFNPPNDSYGPGFANGGGGFGGHGGSGSTPASDTPTASPGVYASGAETFDLFGTSSGYITSRQKPGVNVITSYTPQGFPMIKRVDLYVRDASGGIGLQQIEISDGPFTNMVAESSADASSARTIALPPLLSTDDSSANEVGDIDPVSSCRLEESGDIIRVVGAGDVTDKSLFVATTAMTAQTYTPTSNIISLTPVLLATLAQRLMVGRDSDAAQILTGMSGAPTVSGTMHANTEPLWAAVQSPLNSTTPGAGNLILYANGHIYLLSTTAAIGDAPTATLSNINDGGYGGWRLTLSTDGVARAYFMEPLSDRTSSALSVGAPCRIFSVNFEAVDRKYHDIKLPFIIHAQEWRGGIVATDGKQVKWLNGDVVDLRWNQGRRRIISGETYAPTVQALAVFDERLFACVAYMTDASNNNTLTVWEEFIPEANNGEGGWYFFCNAVRAAGLLPNISKFTNEAAVYQPYDTIVDSGVFWNYTKIDGGLVAATFEWASMPLEPNGLSPYDNQPVGSTTTVSYKFGTTGTVTFPVYHFYDGFKKVWADASYLGEHHGEDSKVTIEHAIQDHGAMLFSGATLAAGGTAVTTTAVFREDDDWKTHYWINPAPDATTGNRVQFSVKVDQGTSGSLVTKTSPNGLPFRLGYYVYLDGQYVDPKLIEPWRYEGNVA